MLKRRDNITIEAHVEDMLARWKEKNEIPGRMCAIIRRWIAGKRLQFADYADFERWAGATAWMITETQADMEREEGSAGRQLPAITNY